MTKHRKSERRRFASVVLLLAALYGTACGKMEETGGCRVSVSGTEGTLGGPQSSDYLGPFSCLSISSEVERVSRLARLPAPDANYRMDADGIIKDTFYFAAEIFIGSPASHSVSGVLITAGNVEIKMDASNSSAGRRYRGFALISPGQAVALGDLAVARIRTSPNRSPRDPAADDATVPVTRLKDSYTVKFQLKKVRDDGFGKPLPPAIE